MHIELRGRGAAVVAVAAAAVLVSAQLFIPPIIGLANNGDFGRIMEYAGLRYREGLTPDQIYFGNIHREFELVRPVRSGTGYVSSAAALALAGRLLGQALSRNGLWDIRALGAVNAAVLLAAIALLAGCVRRRPPAVRWVVAALLVFFFTDVGYVAPLNSFYSQTASLLFLLLTMGIAGEIIARGGAGGWWLAAYFASALLFVSAKPQESLLAPLLAFLGWRLAGAAERTPSRTFWRRPGPWAAIALCAFGAVCYAAIPRRAIKDVGLFHTMFLEILPRSPDPGADLDALGLDRGLLRYSGMNAYLPNAPIDDPAFRAAFYDRFRARDLLLFYLRRPARMLDRVNRGAGQAFLLRTRLGNFEPPAPRMSVDERFGTWSTLRQKLDRRGLLWMCVLVGGNLVLAAATWRRRRRPGEARSRGPHAGGSGDRPPGDERARLLPEAVAVLCGMAVVEFGVCVFGDWLGDTGRHLYAFHAMCDLLIVTDVAWAVDAAVRRRRQHGLYFVRGSNRPCLAALGRPLELPCGRAFAPAPPDRSPVRSNRPTTRSLFL